VSVRAKNLGHLRSSTQKCTDLHDLKHILTGGEEYEERKNYRQYMNVLRYVTTEAQD
jgi:hypothetical protein